MDKVIFEKPDYASLTKRFTVVDMHSHTRASHDCNSSVKAYADKIRSLGIGCAITDHNEISGSLALKKRYPKIFLIPGIEVSSRTDKHILLYFYTHKDMEAFYKRHIEPNKKTHKRTNLLMVKTNLPYNYILDVASDFNAVKVLPHPLLHVTGLLRTLIKKNDFSILKKVNGIEAINSSQSYKANLASTAFAHFARKGYTGGSDAHIIKTLGSTVTASQADTVEKFLENIKKRRTHVIGESNKLGAEMRNLNTIIKNKVFGHKHGL